MNDKNNPADLSYFRLSLLAFLRESHPQLANDKKFINAHAQAALDAYEQAVQNGGNPLEAEYSANETLFDKLHFSKHDTLNEKDVAPARFLDPSAGNGAFAENFKTSFPNMETVCFEKDLLTGKILSHLQPENKVHIRGFEEIENRPDNRFDIVSSNIPFGDVSVFDASFLKSGDSVKKQSARAIHNYFFLKSVEHLREGGIVAFIASQGVMNSPGNEPVRDWLMKNANLVSAVRLPNNLFG